MQPAAYGAFPRLLGEYVRNAKLLDLSEAIYRVTGLPAAQFHLLQRGFIRQDYFADLVIFDPQTIASPATTAQPLQYPTGIDYVIVNGVHAKRSHGRASRADAPRSCRGSRVVGIGVSVSRWYVAVKNSLERRTDSLARGFAVRGTKAVEHLHDVLGSTRGGKTVQAAPVIRDDRCSVTHEEIDHLRSASADGRLERGQCAHGEHVRTEGIDGVWTISSRNQPDELALVMEGRRLRERQRSSAPERRCAIRDRQDHDRGADGDGDQCGRRRADRQEARVAIPAGVHQK